MSFCEIHIVLSFLLIFCWETYTGSFAGFGRAQRHSRRSSLPMQVRCSSFLGFIVECLKNYCFFLMTRRNLLLDILLFKWLLFQINLITCFGAKWQNRHTPAELYDLTLCWLCRHYDDKVAEVQQGFWNCPCVPMRERKECHCMLFLTPDNDFAGTEQVLIEALEPKLHYTIGHRDSISLFSCTNSPCMIYFA